MMLNSFATGGCLICNMANCVDEHRPAASRRSFLATAVAAPVAASSLLAMSASSVHAQSSQPAETDLPSGTFGLQADWTLIMQDGRMEVVDDAVVVVKDGAIDEVRRGGAATGNLTIRRLEGQLLTPGFISGHTHVTGGSATRGIIEGGRSYGRSIDILDTLNDDEYDALTEFNLAEILLSGCTTQVEMSFNLGQAKAYARAAKKWGVRGYVGSMMPDSSRLNPIWFREEDQVLLDSVPGTLEEVAANLAFGKELLAENLPLLKPMMAPHATDTHTPETMKAIYEAAKELGTGLHIHLSQSVRETDRVRRMWGMTPTEWLKSFGFFEMPVFGAHMGGCVPEIDFPVLKEGGGVYAHCPSGGGPGARGGLQPYVEALNAGVRTNVGIDTHSNDYLENMKLAVLFGRMRGRMLQDAGDKDLKLPTIWAAVQGATLNAADGLRRNDLGRIEAGARADLTSIDVSGFIVGTGASPREPLNHLHYANGNSVRDVLIDGSFKVADGTLVVADAAEIQRKGGDVVRKIWEVLDGEDWFTETER